MGGFGKRKSSRNRWIIVLSERIPKSEVVTAVAHEIAHARLGHDKLSLNLPAHPLRNLPRATSPLQERASRYRVGE